MHWVPSPTKMSPLPLVWMKTPRPSHHLGIKKCIDLPAYVCECTTNRMLDVLLYTSFLSDRVSHWTRGLLFWLIWLSSEPRESTCLYLSLLWDYKWTIAIPSFLHGCWASTLPYKVISWALCQKPIILFLKVEDVPNKLYLLLQMKGLNIHQTNHLLCK